MSSGLLDNWREQDFEKAPFILKGDAKFLEAKSLNVPDKLTADENYADLDPKLMHVGLLPVPFAGDLERADIFIGLINPGFGLGIDHYVETIPEYCRVLRRNLKQELRSDPFPFFYLDSRWHWTGGGGWWHRLLGKIIRAVAARRKMSYLSAAKFISTRIASLELVPYHSGNSHFVRGLSDKLKSSQLMKVYAETLAKRAETGKVLLVIASGRSTWKLSSRYSKIVYPPAGARRALFDIHKGPGRKILQRLLEL